MGKIINNLIMGKMQLDEEKVLIIFFRSTSLE